jgi:hypothetical protein
LALALLTVLACSKTESSREVEAGATVSGADADKPSKPALPDGEPVSADGHPVAVDTQTASPDAPLASADAPSTAGDTPPLPPNPGGPWRDAGLLIDGPASVDVPDAPRPVDARPDSFPDAIAPVGTTRIHFRWAWNDPTDPKTPYPGTACPLDFANKMGFSVPPYPPTLKVTGLPSEISADLELRDGSCPWYTLLIPDEVWPTSGPSKTVVFRHPDDSKSLFTTAVALPARTTAIREYWIAYAGAPDNTIASASKCLDWSLQSNSYFITTSNPGPGCGAGPSPDPCNPPQPSGYHTVHFRYLWASQSTFTLFPKTEVLPTWIVLEVNGASNAQKVVCPREQDRPWFACPVPDSMFGATTTWRAVDKLHTPEWNTVKPWPLPATPKDYWIRWYFGAPDVPRSSDPPNFMVFDYDPDASSGTWSATGSWNDSMCAPRKPASPITVGFGNGAWFPYKKTSYLYPYGASLAYVYQDQPAVQGALDAFVWERYNLWKKNRIKQDSDACGVGTARVHSEFTDPTVSEGQGYGMAMAAAVGDKELFGKLWEFVRHYRSQKKYCFMMGWSWKGPSSCLAADEGGKDDSEFDADADIAIGLVYAAMQWPDLYSQVAVDWIKGLECEINAKVGDGYNYPTNGDSWNKTSCSAVGKCDFDQGTKSAVFLDYLPPGYFRVFGDFMETKLGKAAKATNGQSYRDFWYKTAETVWELVERCYDAKGVHKALAGNLGTIEQPCLAGGGEPYEWERALWRLAIDAAWFGDNTSLPENKAGSSSHFGPKSRLQAKMDNIQNFFSNFYKANPPAPNANRFSTICHMLGTDGAVTNCDPAYGHNAYTVNMALATYATMFDDGGQTTPAIRREALEEAISTAVRNDHYFEESLGVYSLLFLTGNFPNPMNVPK